MSDYNVYYSSDGVQCDFQYPPDVVNPKNLTLTQWQNVTTLDKHSLYGVDPLFVDVLNDDFRLKAKSPAAQLGIANISSVGPRSLVGPYTTN